MSFADDEVAWARECAAAGDSFDEIAAALEISVSDIPDLIGVTRKLTPGQAAAAECWAAGMTLREIALDLGIVPRSVSNRLERARFYGYAVPRRPGPTRGDGSGVIGRRRRMMARRRAVSMSVVTGQGESPAPEPIP